MNLLLLSYVEIDQLLKVSDSLPKGRLYVKIAGGEIALLAVKLTIGIGILGELYLAWCIWEVSRTTVYAALHSIVNWLIG